jgi:ABC-type Fe3+-hydroxamate transport system substrate-binding protein
MNDRLVSAESPVFPDWGNRAFSFLALAFLVCAAGACERAPAAEPDRHSAQRIVSVVPSVTELIVALGATDRVSARTAYDDDPLLRGLPTLGRTMQPSAEAVLALQPDLFIDASYAHSKQQARVLAQHGVQTLTTDLQAFADVRALIDTLGDLLGLQGRADSLNAKLEERRSALRNNQPAERPTALYLIWPNPARIAGGGTYIDEVLQLASARNAFADLKGWPQVTIESIVDRNPDYIVVPAGRSQFSSTALQKLPGWRELAAVRNGRVVEVPAGLMERPGLRALDGAELLRRLLHQRESER